MREFFRVNIEVSNVCNLQCSFCPEVVRAKALMDPSLFRYILHQVAPLTKMVTLHLMGDPLVHPQLGELVDICEEQGVKIFLVTNGVLLKEKEAEILLRPSFRQISFSLHSYPDNFPNQDPSLYLERIFQFTERAFQERPFLFINYRLWNLADPGAQIAANRQLLDLIEKRYGIKVPVPDLRVKKNLIVKNRLSLHFETEFVWPNLELPFLGEVGTCHGLRSHFGILVDGTVVPCCLDKEGKIGLGNIHQTPLEKILKSPRSQAIREGFRNHRLVEDLCRRCQYIERFESRPVPLQKTKTLQSGFSVQTGGPVFDSPSRG